MDAVVTIQMTVAEGSRSESEIDRVRAARSGDRDAFGELVRLHERRVFRLASRFFHEPGDVEDAAQETFVTAWRKLGTYRASAPFEHWLTRVCLNCCYAMLRRRRSRPEETLAEPDLQPAAAHDRDAPLEVERLLRRLGPEDRFVLTLLDGEGWSVPEIAEKLGWTRVNVRVRAHRARKRLRAILEGDLP